MALLLPVLIVLLALDVFCLVDLSRAEEVHTLPKWAWAIIIVVMHFLGAIGYLTFGKKRHGDIAGIGRT
jgi:branched-subunit amino acid transport protein AzlD